jgi:hypothetical protein
LGTAFDAAAIASSLQKSRRCTTTSYHREVADETAGFFMIQRAQIQRLPIIAPVIIHVNDRVIVYCNLNCHSCKLDKFRD